MNKSRFSEEQMVEILREADRGCVSEVARKHQVRADDLYLEAPVRTIATLR